MVLRRRVAGLGVVLALGCGRAPAPRVATAAPSAAARPPGQGVTPTPGPAKSLLAAGEASTVDAAVAGDSPSADPTAEKLYVDGVRLELVPEGCRLTAEFRDQRKTHRFDFPGPCHFSPDRHGEPWIVATEQGNALLVESWADAADGHCDTALQLVVFTERGPELSSQIQRVSRCGPGPWDEMMYHVMSAKRVALGSDA